MSRVTNSHHACRKCGAKVKSNVRFCTRCAIERKVQAKALRLFGIPPEKIVVSVVQPRSGNAVANQRTSK